MNKPTLLADIHRTHAELLAAASGLDDAAYLAEAPGMPGWTRKDVVAHVAWWSDHSARIVDALLAGREPYDRRAPFDVDALNARILAEGRGRTLAEVLDGEAEAFRRVVAAVETASEADLFETGRHGWLTDGTLADVVEGNTSGHWPEHVPHLSPG